MSRDVEKAKDEVKAGAYQLAAALSRVEAARFLRRVANDVEAADWAGRGGQ